MLMQNEFIKYLKFLLETTLINVCITHTSQFNEVDTFFIY